MTSWRSSGLRTSTTSSRTSPRPRSVPSPRASTRATRRASARPFSTWPDPRSWSTPATSNGSSDAGARPPALDPDPDRLVAIVFTSGTTGTPKGAMFGNRELLAIARADIPNFDDEASWGAGGPMLASTAFAHIGSMTKMPWYLRLGHHHLPARPLAGRRRARPDQPARHDERRRRRAAGRAVAAGADVRPVRPLSGAHDRHGRRVLASRVGRRGPRNDSVPRTRSATRRRSPVGSARPPRSMRTTRRRCSRWVGRGAMSRSTSATTTDRPMPIGEIGEVCLRSTQHDARLLARPGRHRGDASRRVAAHGRPRPDRRARVAPSRRAGPRRCSSGAATTSTRSRSRRCSPRTPPWPRSRSCPAPTR